MPASQHFPCRLWLMWLLVVNMLAVLGTCEAFALNTPPPQRQSMRQDIVHRAWRLQRPFANKASRPCVLLATPSSSSGSREEDDELQKLLEKATRLREEANALESKLRNTRETSSSSKSQKQQISTPAPAIQYDKIADSVWALTYRFTPTVSNGSEDDKQENPSQYFRGQVKLRFRSDGYTDIVSHKSSDAGIAISKVWGWDEEISQEDQKRYVLFSMDIDTPSSIKDRVYFQARIDDATNKSQPGAIALKEGTVTIKQDLAETKKMMNFGFFSPKGILAQFRYVGDFVAKPAQAEDQ